jgi:hypothetical protein
MITPSLLHVWLRAKTSSVATCTTRLQRRYFQEIILCRVKWEPGGGGGVKPMSRYHPGIHLAWREKNVSALQVNKMISKLGITLLQILSSIPLRFSQLYDLKDIYDERGEHQTPISSANGDDDIKTTITNGFLVPKFERQVSVCTSHSNQPPYGQAAPKQCETSETEPLYFALQSWRHAVA